MNLVDTVWNPVNTVTNGSKNLAVLTGHRINEGFFYKKLCMALLPGSQKSGRNNNRGDRITEVVVRRGFTAQQTQHGVVSGIPSQANSCKEVSALTLSRSHNCVTLLVA